MRYERRGFSRVDLAALVVALCVMGAMVVVFAMSSADRSKRRIVCVQRQMEVGKASTAWAHDHRGELPNFNWRVTTLSGWGGKGKEPENDLTAVQVQATELLRRITNHTELELSGDWLPQVRYTWLLLLDGVYLTQSETSVCPEDRELLAAREHCFGSGPSRDPWLDKVLPQGIFDSSLKAYASTYEFGAATWTPFGGTNVSGKRWPAVEQGATEDEYRVPSRLPFGFGSVRLDHAAFSEHKVWLFDSKARHMGSLTRSYADPMATQFVVTFDLSAHAEATRDANPGGRPNDPCSPEPTTFVSSSESGRLGGGASGDLLKGYYRWTRNGIRGSDFGEAEPPPWKSANELAPDKFTVTTPWPKGR